MARCRRHKLPRYAGIRVLLVVISVGLLADVIVGIYLSTLAQPIIIEVAWGFEVVLAMISFLLAIHRPNDSKLPCK